MACLSIRAMQMTPYCRYGRLRTRCSRVVLTDYAPALDQPSFENPPLECYKSDLRHALNFAYTEQTAGFQGLYLQALDTRCWPGRGSRLVSAWHGFLFRLDKGATFQPVKRSIAAAASRQSGANAVR